jgi:hypothetical protein
VVAKLAEPNEFFALQLYDTLIGSGSLRVDVEPEDEQIFDGEQGRAGREALVDEIMPRSRQGLLADFAIATRTKMAFI